MMGNLRTKPLAKRLNLSARLRRAARLVRRKDKRTLYVTDQKTLREERIRKATQVPSRPTPEATITTIQDEEESGS
jgi:hypothetical protein